MEGANVSKCSTVICDWTSDNQQVNNKRFNVAILATNYRKKNEPSFF